MKKNSTSLYSFSTESSSSFRPASPAELSYFLLAFFYINISLSHSHRIRFGPQFISNKHHIFCHKINILFQQNYLHFPVPKFGNHKTLFHSYFLCIYFFFLYFHSQHFSIYLLHNLCYIIYCLFPL